MTKTRDFDIREQILFKRIYSILSKNKNRKYYSRFGNFHTPKTETNFYDIKTNSFSSLLKEKNINIISIFTLYAYSATNYKTKKWDDYSKTLKKTYKFNSKLIEQLMPFYRRNNSNHLIMMQNENEKYFNFILFLNQPISYYY